MIEKLNEVRKLIAYLVGVLGEVLATGLIPEPYAHYAQLTIVVGTAVAIYKLPNDEPAGRHAA